jgi:hypothetical protein
MSIAARAAALVAAKGNDIKDEDNGSSNAKLDFSDCGDKATRFTGLMNQGWALPSCTTYRPITITVSLATSATLLIISYHIWLGRCYMLPQQFDAKFVHDT